MLKGFLEHNFLGGRGLIYSAYAEITAPGIWSTAAGTGGPVLVNGSAIGGGRGVTAFLMAMSFGLKTASTVSGALGITGAAGQVALPTTSTAISAAVCISPIGGPAPQCNVYSTATLTHAGTFFVPVGHIHTGAVTVDTDGDNLVHLGGSIQVPTGAWASPAGSIILSSAVIEIGLVWIEIPND